MKIEIDDLLHVINIISENIRENFPDGIEIENEDYYWEIDDNDLYNPYLEENDLDISMGQISFDWESLLRLKDKNSIPISYDVKRLSVMFRIINKKGYGVW